MRVVVVHYEAAEAAALAEWLRRDGVDAEPCLQLGGKVLRELRNHPPDTVLIDLMRMPSYGRGIAVLLRESKSTRGIPIVFIEGDPEKTALVREVLPDGVCVNPEAEARSRTGHPPSTDGAGSAEGRLFPAVQEASHP